MIDTLIGAILALFVGKTTLPVTLIPAREKVLSAHEFSMEKRYGDKFVNHVFAENILLTLAYARGAVKLDTPVNWDLVNRPFSFDVSLNPGVTLAYHDSLLDKYEKSGALVFTQAHFNGAEGFLSDGYLIGDGTCQLASLIRWVGDDAGLAVEAPVNHDFAAIPEVPKEKGVAIYSNPNARGSSALQNLYIQNNRSHAVKLGFNYDGLILKVQAIEAL